MTEKGGCLRRKIRRFRLQMRALVLEVDIMAAHLLALVLDCIQFIVETLEHITFVFDISNCDLAF